MLTEDQVAVCIASPHSLDTTIDTIERIKKHVTKNVICVYDMAGKHIFEDIKLNDCPLIEGIYHGINYSAYRNQLIGLMNLKKMFPGKKWYGHIEWDVMINGNILEDLDNALPIDMMAGFSIKEYPTPWQYLSEKLGIWIGQTRYALGCLQFYHGNFLERLDQINFWEIVLKYGKVWTRGYPDYKEYSVDEGLLPSVCMAFGGGCYELGNWDKRKNSERYGIRYRPEWNYKSVPNHLIAVHPVKQRIMEEV